MKPTFLQAICAFTKTKDIENSIMNFQCLFNKMVVYLYIF